ncbi:tRNA (adenosine(37)-N6)-threonylcarbamoyltransferase complex ATPase subunit type 1 TsaE [Rickettsiales bacterium]|nr:tRNA (adenosine(37)-N6)-threonylcarbamoyltransferase complex ATPase subunit type 1 TsaE [Rickettsiales bacterium]
MSQFFIQDKEQMRLLARQLAEQALCNNIYALTGTLGSGKTFFAKEFINSLQKEKDTILSPTFNIVNYYESQKGLIYHFDLYRIEDENELENIDFFDSINSAICLIEWPEIALKFLPSNYIEINISHNIEDKLQTRTVKITHNAK